MNLQQLRYVIAIASSNSISAAAHKLYISQSSLSLTVKDIEQECGITIFERSSKGITITPEGNEFLSYARQVVEQAELMEARYIKPLTETSQRLSVATQHYAFAVEVFLEFVEEYEGEDYTFLLRETSTANIIEDVANFKSEIGILYLSQFNQQVLQRTLDAANLSFTQLFQAKPHVFVSEHHPLASCSVLNIEELDDYPRYTFDQGKNNSFFYSEEPFGERQHKKKVIISDRGTLSNLLAHHNGFTVSTGILSSEMHSGIVAIPLQTKERMTVGYITHTERQLPEIAQKYIERLKLFIEQFNTSYAGL